MAKQSVTMKKCDNDLFYLCSLIVYIAKKTYNTKEYVINKIKKKFEKMYLLAEVYHSENITSWIIPKIDNYDSRIYYENPSFIYECHKEGKVL
ncbi:MAG: hypothetical protein U0M92_06170 [Bacilli bacterium]